ncbi:lasso peptide biosynthesis B2 protein [Sphingomonas sp. OTU376]|uniref:lasso peptide biosynthesis B2 protein n=1 Tax=Sphingomonas sp. OTU376 TaxID=3043863 RepID=UPI00313DF259
MHLANPEGVHFCFVGDRAIFLDLLRDRYTATSPETAAALTRALRGNSILGVDEGHLEPLLNEGLLAITEDPARALAETRQVPAEREWGGLPPASLWLTMRHLAAQLQVFRDMKRIGLARTIDVRSAFCPALNRTFSPVRTVSAYRASNLIYSADQRCLLKSIALFGLLKRSGQMPALVLGVRDAPFAAHAWVELGDAVVSDLVEVISRYTPIMVRR